MWRMGRLAWLFLLLILTACDSGEPGRLSVGDFENDEGEAVVRHLIAHLPPLDPNVPKVYCVVKGPRLMAAHQPFVSRMDDLKLKFVSGESLTVTDPDKSIVDPTTGLSPITLQLLEMQRKGTHGTEVTAGWAYKKTWERHHYRVTHVGSGYEVEDLGRLEGNYVAPVQ